MTAANRDRRSIRGIRTPVSELTLLGRLSSGEGRPEMLDVEDVIRFVGLDVLFQDSDTIDFTYDSDTNQYTADYIGDLGDNADVSLTSLADEEFLQYDSGSGTWINFDLFGTVNTWTADQTFDENVDINGVLEAVTVGGGHVIRTDDAALHALSVRQQGAGPIQQWLLGGVRKAQIANDGAILTNSTVDATSTTTGSIQTDGGLGVAKTIVAGTGIKLGGTAAENLLDDYEEGSWTPVLEGLTVAGTHTYTTQIGKYTKIGNTVFLWLEIVLSALDGAASGNVAITGIPFTTAGTHRGVGSVAYFGDINLSAGYTFLGTFTGSGASTSLSLRQSGDNVADIGVTIALLSNTTKFVAAISYQV